MEGIFEDSVHNTPPYSGRQAAPTLHWPPPPLLLPNIQKTPSGAQVPPLTSDWNLHQFLISEGFLSRVTTHPAGPVSQPEAATGGALDRAHRLLSLPLDASLLISFNQPIMYCQPHSGILIGTWSQAPPLLPPPLGPPVASGHHGLACRPRECQVTIRLAPLGAHGRRASLSLSLFLL